MAQKANLNSSLATSVPRATGPKDLSRLNYICVYIVHVQSTSSYNIFMGADEQHALVSCAYENVAKVMFFFWDSSCSVNMMAVTGFTSSCMNE